MHKTRADDRNFLHGADAFCIMYIEENSRSLKKKKEYEFTGKVVKYFKGKDVEKEKTMDYCINNCRNFVEIVEEEDEE